MSKSLEYCRVVASDKTRSSYADRDWSKATECEAEPIFDLQLEGERELTVTGTDDRGERFSARLDLVFDPSADFQYFTSESCKHDGTFLFIDELYANCVAKVCCLKTWYSFLDTPKAGDHVRFTVGNFVSLNEYGKEIAPEVKPWMQQRTTVLLPLKVEYVK